MTFWFLAAAMAAMAVALVVVPLLRARAAAGPSGTEANLEVLRGQRREIEEDIAAGTLPADAREEALADLVDRAADDLAPEAAASVAPARRPWGLAAGMGIAIPAIALAVYLVVGAPQALEPHAAASPAAPALDDKQIVSMVESLAEKMKERPDDPKGWALLARSMAGLGRFQESAAAYERLARLQPGDAQVLADYADVLGMAQGRSLAGRPAELARQALAIDPRNMKALALSGTAAADAGDIPGSLRHWEALKALLPAGSEDAQQVDRIIAEVRGQAGKAPGAGSPAAAAVAQGSVSGTVTISRELGGKLTGEETLFVFARAEGGPRAPLAVVRASARKLPFEFSLDDSQAMAPGMNISSAAAVRIEARISRSGNATPQPGDLVGTSAVVKPGARGVAITIDKVLP